MVCGAFWNAKKDHSEQCNEWQSDVLAQNGEEFHSDFEALKKGGCNTILICREIEGVFFLCHHLNFFFNFKRKSKPYVRLEHLLG